MAARRHAERCDLCRLRDAQLLTETLPSADERAPMTGAGSNWVALGQSILAGANGKRSPERQPPGGGSRSQDVADGGSAYQPFQPMPPLGDMPGAEVGGT